MCHALKGGPLAHEMTRVDPWDDPGTMGLLYMATLTPKTTLM